MDASIPQPPEAAISTLSWLLRPACWSRSQQLIAAGIALRLVAVGIMWLNDWEMSSAYDGLADPGMLLIVLGFANCLRHRAAGGS